jgi:hypothetical protein
MARTHKDVEYHVEGLGRTQIFTDPRDAFVAVGDACVSRGEATLDVVIWSKAGAKAYGGDDAVERYEEDPEASVFERFEFRCNAVGRVP